MLKSCFVTIVEFNQRKKFRGVFETSGDELSVYIEYDSKNKGYQLSDLGGFLNKTELFNLVIISQDGNAITGLGCFSKTPFEECIIYNNDGTVSKSFVPLSKFGLIEFFCNRWIENVPIKSSSEMFWNTASLHFPDIDRWFAGAEKDHWIPISNGITVSFNLYPNDQTSLLEMSTIKEYKGKIDIKSTKMNNLDKLFEIEHSLYLFVQYVLNIPIASPTITILMGSSDENMVSCECHYRPKASVSSIKPTMNTFHDCKLSVPEIQNSPEILIKWFELYETQRGALSKYCRTLDKNKGFVDERIEDLVKTFDSLRGIINPPGSDKKNAFKKWVNKVSKYGEELKNTGAAINKDRITGALQNLIYPSLKSQLNDYLSKHIEEVKPLKGDDAKPFVSFVTDLRNSEAHGKVSSCNKKTLQYEIWQVEEIMRQIDRILISEIILA